MRHNNNDRGHNMDDLILKGAQKKPKLTKSGEWALLLGLALLVSLIIWL